MLKYTFQFDITSGKFMCGGEDFYQFITTFMIHSYTKYNFSKI